MTALSAFVFNYTKPVSQGKLQLMFRKFDAVSIRSFALMQRSVLA